MRRAAARTNAFSTAARGTPRRQAGRQDAIRLANNSRGSRRLAVSAENLLDIFFPSDGVVFHGFLFSLAARAATDL
jgi:hypothetical protein